MSGKTFIKAVSFIGAMVLCVAQPLVANAELQIWTAGGTMIDSTSYVKIFDDVGAFNGALRLVGFSTADGDYTITSNRTHASATGGVTFGLPTDAYVHQLSSGARFDGTTTKSIRVMLAQPSGSTALYARITAVTTATGDYTDAEDLRSYLETHPGVGTSSTDADVLAANAVTKIQVAFVASSFLTWVNGSGTGPDGVTLGDGKLLVQCNAGGNVTNVVARPAGEDLIVTGDAMTFAAGAKIEFAAPAAGAVAGGSLVFANDVTAAGALNLTRTDGAYVVWEASGSNDRLSEAYKVIIPDGVAHVGDWELVMSYVGGVGQAYQTDTKTQRGPYQPMRYDPGVGTDTGVEYRFYLLNRFRAQHGYTWSQRIQMARDTTGDNTAKLKVRCPTVVHSPQNVCLPKTDLWATWYKDMPLNSGLFCAQSTYDNDVKNKATNKPVYGKSTLYVGIDRLILRRTGSAATVGFAGEATLNGAVDISLGVKLAVLPKGGSTFAAPVFYGQGDVEYQRNATLAKENYMTYATDLSVANGALVTVSAKTAFPTNALVNVRKDGIMRLTANVGGNGNGISAGYAELHVHPGGELQVSKATAGKISNGRQEIYVDGGTYWVGWDGTYSATTDDANFYTPYLTLLGGAHVKGRYMRWGNNSAQRWVVGGAAGSSANAVVVDAIKHFSYQSQTFTLVVNDITGDDEADLVVNGKVIRAGTGTYGSANSWTIPFQKYGDGTVRFNDKVVLRGTMTVNGGKILFGDNGETYPTTGTDSEVLSKDRDIVLMSGTALGKTANHLELGTLELSGDDAHTLELGPTATISFADSHAKTWAGPLLITGFREDTVRFGTSASGLTAAQVADIRAVTESGKQRRVVIGSNGYLRFPGFLMVVR